MSAPEGGRQDVLTNIDGINYEIILEINSGIVTIDGERKSNLSIDRAILVNKLSGHETILNSTNFEAIFDQISAYGWESEINFEAQLSNIDSEDPIIFKIDNQNIPSKNVPIKKSSKLEIFCSKEDKMCYGFEKERKYANGYFSYVNNVQCKDLSCKIDCNPCRIILRSTLTNPDIS